MKQKIYLITGLMASGKSTVSDLLAKSIEKCVQDVYKRQVEEPSAPEVPKAEKEQVQSPTPGKDDPCLLYTSYPHIY